jgi:molecular chaperone IbpA
MHACARLLRVREDLSAWLPRGAGRGCRFIMEDELMTRFDFAPLYRSTVGFDRLAQLMDSVAGLDSEQAYPPYNIERLGENEYRITMAVAGFKPEDLKVEVKESTLYVRGEKKPETGEAAQEFLHRGIASRCFDRRFQLADYVEVKSADLKDGLLHIDLVRNLPERMKPRTIAISAKDESQRIEARA